MTFTCYSPYRIDCSFSSVWIYAIDNFFSYFIYLVVGDKYLCFTLINLKFLVSTSSFSSFIGSISALVFITLIPLLLPNYDLSPLPTFLFLIELMLLKLSSCDCLEVLTFSSSFLTWLTIEPNMLLSETIDVLFDDPVLFTVFS